MTRNVCSPDAIGPVVLLMLFAGFWSDSAQACSLVSVAWSREESIRLSMYFWFGSAVLGSMCIAAAVYRGRWILTAVIVAVIMIFHPWWTVSPTYAPDCTFDNVEASELALALLGVLLSYHLFRIFKARMQSRPSA